MDIRARWWEMVDVPFARKGLALGKQNHDKVAHALRAALNSERLDRYSKQQVREVLRRFKKAKRFPYAVTIYYSEWPYVSAALRGEHGEVTTEYQLMNRCMRNYGRWYYRNGGSREGNHG